MLATTPSQSPMSSPIMSNGPTSTLLLAPPHNTPAVSPATPSSPSTASTSSISLRSVVSTASSLGHALLQGDSNIISLLHNLAEKGKARHEDRKKRKRSKKEKQEGKSSTWSADTFAAATAAAKESANAKKTPPKRKRSVSDARMFTSADAHIVHRDRSISMPTNTVTGARGGSAISLPSTPRHKSGITRSHSATSSAALARDPPTVGGKPKKTNSASSSPTVLHHHSSSAVPTSPIKKSPRIGGRSSSVCGSSSSVPIRRTAPTTAVPSPASYPAHASTAAMAALLSPRTERIPAPGTEAALCAHGRPHHHHHHHHATHQSRSSLVTTGHHHTCRHARSVPTSLDFDTLPTIAVSSGGQAELEWAIGDAELESILRGIEQSVPTAASHAATPPTTPFLTASPSDSTSSSPVPQMPSAPDRRTSLDIMHIADTMQRVSIESKEDDFDPMHFLDLQLATATAAVAAAQQPLPMPTPIYPHAATVAPPYGYASYNFVEQQQQQQHRPAFNEPQQLTRSVSSPHSLNTPTATGSEAFGMPSRCNSDVGFFSALMLKEDEQQMRELFMAIDGASTSIPEVYYDATN